MSKHDEINQFDFNIEQHLDEILSTFSIEKKVEVKKEKLIQQLTDAFYIYESPQAHYVFDRDMPNVIYSLGFVPVGVHCLFSVTSILMMFSTLLKSLHEMNQLIFAMRYHPNSRRIEREEIDADHHLIHFADYADVIIPKSLKGEYQPANEDELFKCLQRLDQTNRNYLHKKVFVQTLSSMEDVFDHNESEELMNFLMQNSNLAIDHLPDFFNYKNYLKHLLPKRHRIFLELSKQQEH